MKLGKIVLSFAFALLLTGVALAGSLENYKDDGYIGEMSNGLLGVVTSSAPKEAKSLVKEINEERLERYQTVARKNGISLEQTQKLAGKKLISQTPSGGWIQKPSGEWIQK